MKRLSGERNALHRAAGYGHLGIVCELTKAGFNPLTASHTGRIPLHEACQGIYTSYSFSITLGKIINPIKDWVSLEVNYVDPFHCILFCEMF